jgi:predicted aspartyl protease
VIRLLCEAALLLLTIPLAMAEPFEVVGKIIVVNATVNGHGPFRLILDTGATDTILTPPTAAKLGLRGTARSVVSTLRVAGVTATNLPVIITDPPQAVPLRLDHGLDYHGLLGHTFLSQYVLTLDYRQRTVTLALPGAKEPDGEKIPFTVLGRSLLAQGTIDGQGPLPILVDTGSAEVVVLSRVVTKLGLKVAASRQQPGLAFGVVDRVALGRAEARRVPFVVFDPASETAAAPAYAAIFGTPFLSKFVVTIHYPKGYLQLIAQ